LCGEQKVLFKNAEVLTNACNMRIAVIFIFPPRQLFYLDFLPQEAGAVARSKHESVALVVRRARRLHRADAAVNGFGLAEREIQRCFKA
jgi:hypothetical protein